jgi:hypothetical protein
MYGLEPSTHAIKPVVDSPNRAGTSRYFLIAVGKGVAGCSATLLHPHQDAVQRLAEVPGFGVDSAQQIIAEVGPTAATFPSEKCLSSWVVPAPAKKRALA